MSSANPSLAFLLTWTCYGTWLHGDRRGSVDDRNNAFDTPVYAKNADWRDHEQVLLKYLSFHLVPEARSIVEEAIGAHCLHRGWTLHAKSARTNHVHVVVSCEIDPDRAMAQFKSWCTRRLREGRLARPDANVWTEGGSTRYLWTREDVLNAVRYVEERQDLESPPMR